MVLLDIIARSLGLKPSPKPREHGPFALTHRARRYLGTLPDGMALHVDLAPGLVVEEGSSDGAVDGMVFASPDIGQRLRGYHLDRARDGWRVRVELAVNPVETPNPESRLYLCDRRLSDGRVEFVADEAAPPLARRLFAIDGIARVLFNGHGVTLERSRPVNWYRVDRAVESALENHFLAFGTPIDAESRPTSADPIVKAIREELEANVLPSIHAHGGDLELVSYKDGVVRVRFVGACRTCPVSTLTLQAGVAKALKDAFPDLVERVEAV